MQVLGCLLTLLLVGFFIVLSLGFSIIDAILRMFGRGRRTTINRNEQTTTENAESSKKKFSADEGEYIDFEEV